MMDELDIADLTHRLRQAHRILNPGAVLRLCAEAADAIDELQKNATASSRRSRKSAD